MSKRVLIVDDEESILSSLERLLSFEKFKTFTAGDGRTAIRLGFTSGGRLEVASGPTLRGVPLPLA